jgi:microcystin-dependent protein
MSDQFLGEIRMMSFPFAPRYWALCNGQLLPINQNQALFSLLGTTYGGDGRTTFALPNLQGRIPIHTGSGYVLGQQGGEAAHTLTSNEVPPHGHTAQGSSANGTVISPAGALLAQRASQAYHAPTNTVAMMNGSLANYGGGQPHQNMQPYLTISFCIALQGVFPSQN